MLITLLTTKDLEIQQNRINNHFQDDLILGCAIVTVELYIEDKSVSNAELTFELKLPMSLKPEEFFTYINSKIIDDTILEKKSFKHSN